MKENLMAYQPVDPDDEIRPPDAGPSFADILSEYEHGRQKPREEGAEGRDGVVVALSPEFVFVDVGLKTEGVMETSAFGGELPKRGDTLQVSITGRNPEGYYTLSTIKVAFGVAPNQADVFVGSVFSAYQDVDVTGAIVDSVPEQRPYQDFVMRFQAGIWRVSDVDAL